MFNSMKKMSMLVALAATLGAASVTTNSANAMPRGPVVEAGSVEQARHFRRHRGFRRFRRFRRFRHFRRHRGFRRHWGWRHRGWRRYGYRRCGVRYVTRWSNYWGRYVTVPRRRCWYY